MEELKYFFSYTRNDSEFVLKLAKELRAVGANVWLDQLDILGGQHWDSTVEKALKSCKGMMAVLSPESVASDNVMDEVSYALNEGKLVVPVLIRPCNIPYRLQRLQYIDFTADYETGFSQLLKALGIEQPLQPLESTAAQEPPLPKQPESAVGEQKEAEVHSKRQKTKVLAAICIVALIVIVSIVIFLKYLQSKTYEPKPKTYELDIPQAIGGSVTKDPNKASYKHGQTVTLEAVPNKGYRFTKWSGDLSGSTNPATIKIDSKKSITASFALRTYSLTATAGAGGAITPSGAVPVKSGAEQSFTMTPEDGYQIGDVLVDGISVGAVDTYTFTNVTADHTIAANFVRTYSLDIPQAVGGSVKKSPDKTSYKHGETVTLEAVPNTGYSFKNWSGDLSGSTNPATLVMDADKSVTASFFLKSVVTPPGYYIHRGCVAFGDQENVIIGPITSVKVCHGDYIYGLQLSYGSQNGLFFGLNTREFGLQVTPWPVPKGERIVRVEGQIAKHGSDFLYVSYLQFITDKGNRSPWFGGKPGTPFTAVDKNGLPLRTISGWTNLRRHPALKRAITSMNFHFGD